MKGKNLAPQKNHGKIIGFRLLESQMPQGFHAFAGKKHIMWMRHGYQFWILPEFWENRQKKVLSSERILVTTKKNKGISLQIVLSPVRTKRAGKEMDILVKLEKMGIPVERALGVVVDQKTGKRLTIKQFAAGKPLNELKVFFKRLNPTVRRSVIRRMGKWLAKIHNNGVIIGNTGFEKFVLPMNALSTASETVPTIIDTSNTKLFMKKYNEFGKLAFIELTSFAAEAITNGLIKNFEDLEALARNYYLQLYKKTSEVNLRVEGFIRQEVFSEFM